MTCQTQEPAALVEATKRHHGVRDLLPVSLSLAVGESVTASTGTRNQRMARSWSSAAIRNLLRNTAPASCISCVIVPFASICPRLSIARRCTTGSPVSGSASRPPRRSAVLQAPYLGFDRSSRGTAGRLVFRLPQALLPPPRRPQRRLASLMIAWRSQGSVISSTVERDDAERCQAAARIAFTSASVVGLRTKSSEERGGWGEPGNLTGRPPASR